MAISEQYENYESRLELLLKEMPYYVVNYVRRLTRYPLPPNSI